MHIDSMDRERRADDREHGSEASLANNVRTMPTHKADLGEKCQQGGKTLLLY